MRVESLVCYPSQESIQSYSSSSELPLLHPDLAREESRQESIKRPPLTELWLREKKRGEADLGMSSSTVVHEGWMVRCGRSMIGRSFIHMRYFVLESQVLSYYKHKLGGVPPINSVQIDGDCRVEDRGLTIHDGHMLYVLCVYSKRKKHKGITMAAFNIQEALIWKDKLDMLIDQQGAVPSSISQQEQSLKCGKKSSFSGHESQYMESNVLERILDGRDRPTNLKLSLLEHITANFSCEYKIGNGGCGEVYKGILPNGIVAVKRLFKSHTMEDKMFHQEVKSMMMVKHPNIVPFLGYCSNTQEHAIEMAGNIVMAEVRERLLCFEYISNGSLENHLTDELRGLEWHTRYQIIKGVCEGLNHLHYEKGILHMDLKPANILIDDHMVPKITDFGLSRLEEKSQTMSTQRLVSRAYCAPEYLHQGKISNKLDIYSLGIIIIEMVTGSKEQPNITKVRVVLPQYIAASIIM